MVALVAVAWLTIAGWEVRKQAWDYFAPGRFRYDIQRNYNFGTLVLRDGWLNLYDDQGQIIREASKIEDRRRRNQALQPAMNYSPLRALIFSRWAKSTGQPDERTKLGHTPRWREDDKENPRFNAWMSNFNSTLALVGAVAAGLLVCHWSRYRRDADALIDQRTLWQRGWPILAATIAFAAFWYNPGGLILAHGWPSANSWVLPFFLWALLMASWECWFVSGIIIGIGAMAQGQHLLVAPIFLLWPIFAGQPLRAVRWLSGFGIAFMGVVAGWMLTIRPDPAAPERIMNWPAVWWIGGSALLLALLPAVRWILVKIIAGRAEPLATDAGAADAMDADPPVAVAAGDDAQSPAATEPATTGRWRAASSLAIALLVSIAALLALTWPLLPMVKTQLPMVLGALMWAGAAVCLLWFAGWRAVRYAVPMIAAIQLLLCMPLFGATDSWWLVGYKYGTERHYDMAVGACNNLGALLSKSYGFKDLDEVVATFEPRTLLGLPREAFELTMRTLMLSIYAVSLVLASIAAAIQWRRRDPNFLLAATVPWLLFALLPPQMHERYLGFAGLAAAVWIGARGGMGWWLFGAAVSCIAYGQVARCMSYQAGHLFSRLEGTENERLFLNNEFFRQVDGATPGLSWALLLGMLMVLYASFLRSRPARPRPLTPDEPPLATMAELHAANRLLGEPLPA